MAQIAKLEAKAEIRSPAAKVYDFLKFNLSNLVHLFPQVFKSYKLVEGEEGQSGNVKVFEYVIGKAMMVKVKTEAVNDEERSMRMRAVEGDMLQLYSSFEVNITVADGCVTWAFEFEKKSDSAPNPDAYAKVATQVTKGLDLYLLTN